MSAGGLVIFGGTGYANKLRYSQATYANVRDKSCQVLDLECIEESRASQNSVMISIIISVVMLVIAVIIIVYVCYCSSWAKRDR